MIFFRCFFSFLLRFSFNLSFLYSRKTRPQLHGIRNSNCKRSSLPLHSTLNARPRATIFENLKQSQEETPTCVLTSPFRLYFGFHFYCLTTYHRNLNFILLIFFFPVARKRKTLKRISELEKKNGAKKTKL